MPNFASGFSSSMEQALLQREAKKRQDLLDQHQIRIDEANLKYRQDALDEQRQEREERDADRKERDKVSADTARQNIQSKKLASAEKLIDGKKRGDILSSEMVEQLDEVGLGDEAQNLPQRFEDEAGATTVGTPPLAGVMAQAPTRDDLARNRIPLRLGGTPKEQIQESVIDASSPEDQARFRQQQAGFTPEPRAPRMNPVFRQSADRRTIEQVGEAPAGAIMMPAPQPRDPVASELAALRLADEKKKRGPGALLAGDATPYRNALGRAILSIPAVRRGSIEQLAGKLWEEGNTSELKDVIRQAAIEAEPVDIRNQVTGRMATLASLKDTRKILADINKAGVPTGWLVGNVEDLARRLGSTTNPQYVELANRLQGTLINYRRSATGVQFGEREGEEYKRMFPNYKNQLPVNLALISGLEREMQTYDTSFWNHKLGPQGAALVGMVSVDAVSNAAPTQDGQMKIRKIGTTKVASGPRGPVPAGFEEVP